MVIDTSADRPIGDVGWADMDAAAVFADLAHRPLMTFSALESLTGPELNARPGGHPNSVAWLVWHSARQADAQLADLTGAEELWSRGGFRARFGLGELGDSIGIGHTPEQARRIVVTDVTLLRDYLGAVLGEVSEYATSLRPAQLSEIIDENYSPAVSRGVRLISLIDDCQQHLGAAAHIAGAVTGRAVGPA